MGYILLPRRIRVLGWPARKYKELNPYTWLLYSSLSKAGVDVVEFSPKNIFFNNYDIVHVHWPEGYLGKNSTLQAFFGTLYVLFLLGVAKLRGAKLVWTAHNLSPHQDYHPFLSRYFWRTFPFILDGIISLSESAYTTLVATHPLMKGIKNFQHKFGHGHYKDVYLNQVTQPKARHDLGVSKESFVFLFVGNITPYKNVSALAHCFHDIQEVNDRLLIAGNPSDKAVVNELQYLAARDSRITLYLEFVKNEDLQTFLNAADLVVFPFSSILNSGSVLLALSFGKPVIVPYSGSMIDLQKLLGDKWVQTYQGDLSSAHLFDARHKAIALKNSNDTLDLGPLSWEKIASDTALFYGVLLQK